LDATGTEYWNTAEDAMCGKAKRETTPTNNELLIGYNLRANDCRIYFRQLKTPLVTSADTFWPLTISLGRVRPTGKSNARKSP
jgi:hypothetical protein